MLEQAEIPRPGPAARPQTAEAGTRARGDDSVQRPPSLSLPKGGGAIRGMGEKFAANPVTGTGSMSVPIAASPGRSGFGPELSLSYDSGSSNGPFGLGWNLSLPSITRKTEKGLPRYRDEEESDVYILSGAEDLVPVLEADGTRFQDDATEPGFVIHRYRPRIEGLFARIERWTNIATGEVHWRSITRDNVTTVYGKDNNSRIFDPGDSSPANPARIFSWLICESHDDKGNAIVYEYLAENADKVDRSQASERNRMRTANRYLKRIKYGNAVSRLIQPDLSLARWMFEIVFDYDEAHLEEVDPDPARPDAQQHRFVRASASAGASWAVRPDPFSSHRAGFEIRTYRRCRRILMFHHIPDSPAGEKGYDGLARSTEFDYADLDYNRPVTVREELSGQASTRLASFIRRITQSGYVRDEKQADVIRNGISYGTYLKKSLPPLEFEYSKAVVQDEERQLDAESYENLPEGLDGSNYQLVDLDGEGVSGILTQQAGALFYKPNQGGGRFGPLRTVARKPSLAALRTGRQLLLDLAGDGQLDLVALAGPTPGFYERGHDQGWSAFRTFRKLPDIRWDDPNLRLVDLDGDGHADVLITEQEVFTWHPSLAEEGFGAARKTHQPLDEERGPRLVFSDSEQSIYLSDMCGDGLSDLVRIRNGEVCYWPNSGYGRFGAKVTMDNAPWFDHPDRFDQRRIRLADIDGSGTNDIIYLHHKGVRLYFNQSGNRLSEPFRLTRFPHVDNISSVITADLLGNGTACLVWSSQLPADARRPVRYIELTGGIKPHLLVKSVNNLGAETEIHYAPSTEFYLRDKREGRPWVTRLPFPVHVVERVVTRDHISGNRFVTRYAYHHGYFDGIEREFRGFAMVEQWDTEEFAALGAGRIPEGTNFEASSHVPPVLTRTWFHTGIYLGRNHVSDFFAGFLDTNDIGEYYREPGLSDAEARALLLDDTILPEGLTAEEEREACRALKGSMLRQEIYAHDGTDEAEHPYTVAEQNFAIRKLQPRKGNRHGVFFTHARESLNYHYERKPADPRISHALTLEVDDYGNVLKSAAIGYGRRRPDMRLSPGDQARQAQILITYTENRVTNAVETADDRRTPLPCESRTYELTGLALPSGRHRFTLDEVSEAGPAAIAIEYESEPTPGRREKRLIEHVRSYYRCNELGGSLPLGELQSLALPFESYKLAFTPGLVTEIYGERATSAMLENGGRYVHTEGDANWWIPSGRIFYSPDTEDTPAQELACAREHFFLPRRYRDPFHTDEVSTESFVTYDAHDLLVKETRDALGNRVTAAKQDYRVLKPEQVIDPNRNRSAVAFDALGMVVGTAVMGKAAPAPVEGDSLNGFTADLTQDQIDQFLANPRGPPAATFLASATTRIIYDLMRYRRESGTANRSPAVAATLVRETHVSDLREGEQTKIQVSLSYSDGFGREIQKKIQAEKGPVPRREAAGEIITGADGQPLMTSHDASPRWVGSGWTVFNNKGKPVRQYEPFFTDTSDFEFDVRIGVSPVLFYDPAGRVIATLHPNHTYEKVVFDPWRQESWDVNDMVSTADPGTDADVGDFFGRIAEGEYLPSWHDLRTDSANAAAFVASYPDPSDRANETRAAEKTRVHAATPTVAHSDSLGRTFLTVANNTFKYSNTEPGDPAVEEFHKTRIMLDIEGNQREVIDARGRLVMRYGYDMLGNRVRQASMEAGECWMLNDVAGKPVYAWDSRDNRFRTAYDPLRRPTYSFLSEGGGPEIVVGRSVYGEERANPEDDNLRGKVIELKDQAGIVTSDRFDFKGNLQESRRRLAREYTERLDWSGAVPLERETYVSHSRYDALNRPTQMTAPHSDRPGAKVNVIQPAYSDASLLDRVDAWLERHAEPAERLDPATANLHAVTDIDYDAKGQRLRVDYGNGVRTTYAYDPLTFRLKSLLTRRAAEALPDDCPEPPPDGWPGCQVQNLHYTHDPAGNITHIRDDAQQTIYFRNRRVEPSGEYTYDAIYRLIEATGREHLGQAGGAPVPHSHSDAPRIGLLHRGDGNAMGRYLERYVYDAVGNFMVMQHRGSDPLHAGWTRTYAYDERSQIEPGEQSNRLTSTTIGAASETYSAADDGYDAHGNMLRMPHLQIMLWDFNDQLKMTQRQKVNDEDVDGVQRHGERSWYVYDAGGQRVRKVSELKTGQVREERIYLGGFEIYRKYGADPLVRETLHITDDKQRIALVETRVRGNETGVPHQLVRYQFSNHLGSASLELDGQSRIIAYEEYAPYGSSTYQAVRSHTETPKRYRYTGKERDEESGLYYHGARYYAPWLGRWVSADPAGLVDGSNLYHYASDSPVCFIDPGGTQTAPPVPVPGHTPYNFVSESPALANWQTAANEVLERRFHGGSPGNNIQLFEQHLQGLPQGPGRTRGTKSNVARRIYNQVRNRFYKLEAANPSFAYSDAELARLARGRAPRAGFQLHHLQHIAHNPEEAVRAGNIVFTQGGASGGLTPGSGHHHLHHSEGAKRLEEFQRRQAARPSTPNTSSSAAATADAASAESGVARTESAVARAESAVAETGRAGRALARTRAAIGSLGRAVEEAAPTLTKVARTTGRGGARVLGVVGKVAGPVAIAESSYRLATANNNLDRIQAGADTVAGAAIYAGPVGEAFSIGYGAGQLLDVGVEAATGESLSSRGARGMESVDRAISSVLPENESLPEYKRENRIAWWLIDTFDL